MYYIYAYIYIWINANNAPTNNALYITRYLYSRKQKWCPIARPMGEVWRTFFPNKGDVWGICSGPVVLQSFSFLPFVLCSISSCIRPRYNRNTLWLRDTVRQTSRGKSAATRPTVGPGRWLPEYMHLRCWIKIIALTVLWNAKHSDLMANYFTVGDRTVALNIIARCSITQTPTGQSKVWWLHARKRVVICLKRI